MKCPNCSNKLSMVMGKYGNCEKVYCICCGFEEEELAECMVACDKESKRG